MCGRYVSPETAVIERAWRVDRRNNNPFPPRSRRYNVLPTTRIPILRAARDGAGDLDLDEARWGLLPVWWKNDKPPSNTINARSDDANLIEPVNV